MAVQFNPVRPNAPSGQFRLLADAIDELAPSRIRAGFAFVSCSGVNALLSLLRGNATWPTLRKQFLAGVSQGITEPEALRKLLLLPNAETRMYLPKRRLDKDSLYALPLFHPKIIYLDARNAPHQAFVIASSANLTGSAIGNTPRNYEFGISMTTDQVSSPNLASAFNPWWNEVWTHSIPVTEQRLRKYADLRTRSFQTNPDSLALVERPTWTQDATHLWIEVGKASGIERHQVEFNEALAGFFGPVVQGKTLLTLSTSNNSWNGRPLTHKRTTFAVDIWRLGMPTVKSGGFPIQDRVIRFSKTTDPSDFRFEIADANSDTALDWERDANLHGHIGRTRGAHARRYGIT